MSNRSNRFECHWQPSRRLLVAYLTLLLVTVVVLLRLDLALWLRLAGCGLCLAHALWTLPRSILLSSKYAVSRLRADPDGWYLYSRATGWQPIELRRDCLALPYCVILRYRLPGRWWVSGLCIVHDSLSFTDHRRLRVRLKFSWHPGAAAG
ncbi:MAG: hypothetical protein CMK71_10715 [Pseudomonadaceae bacterium]|nr:hypothetical protein [Pseudomonadaceae bacterium]